MVLKGTAKTKTSMNPLRTTIEATYMIHNENLVSINIEWSQSN